MVRQTLRDHHNRIIGYIEEVQATRRVKIMDARSATLGWFLPDRNLTTDHTWKVVGRGNQLLRLLPPSGDRILVEPS